MIITKKAALHLSLFIIILYWLLELFIVSRTGILPDSFTDFVIRIAIIKSIHLGVIILLLKLEGDSWHDVGLHLKNWKKQVLIGLLLGLGIFLLVSVGLTTVANILFSKPSESGKILQYFKEPEYLYLWLLVGILGGGLVEEIMRIFVLTRFQKKFGKAGLYFALLFSAFVFGMSHYYQGVGAAISNGIFGLILGGIYIKRRSAIEVITAHAFSDVLAILAAYQLAGQQN